MAKNINFSVRISMANVICKIISYRVFPPPPSPYSKESSPFLVQIVAQCSETNEKSIFRFLQFLFFELLMILFTIFKCF